MASRIRRDHQQKITEAAENLAIAEAVLQTALEALEGGDDRADKKMIGQVLRAAFDSLAAAKERLAAVLADP
jgi:hypothetical protein